MYSNENILVKENVFKNYIVKNPNHRSSHSDQAVLDLPSTNTKANSSCMFLDPIMFKENRDKRQKKGCGIFHTENKP